jgi:hypothetical protein
MQAASDQQPCVWQASPSLPLLSPTQLPPPQQGQVGLPAAAAAHCTLRECFSQAPSVLSFSQVCACVFLAALILRQAGQSAFPLAPGRGWSDLPVDLSPALVLSAKAPAAACSVPQQLPPPPPSPPLPRPLPPLASGSNDRNVYEQQPMCVRLVLPPFLACVCRHPSSDDPRQRPHVSGTALSQRAHPAAEPAAAAG